MQGHGQGAAEGAARGPSGSRDRPERGDMHPALRQRILEHMSTAVVVLDERFRVAALNSAAETLLETSARQSVGLPFARVARDDECTELAGRALAGGRACIERNMRLGRRLVDCTATPLGVDGSEGEGERDADADGDGEVEGGGVLLEMANVEHYQRMSQEGRLLTQNESVEAVVRGLAHEIRNPLGGLRGAAQLLERELGATSSTGLAEYTGIIISEADRLGLLVDRLLMPAAPVDPEPVNVHRVTEHVCALVEAESAPRVALVRDYDPSIPPLRGSFDQLVQAVLNVVRNAVQAKGDRIVIRTRVVHQAHIGRRQHPLAGRIDVLDNGAGVPPDLADAVFFPMVSGRAEGSGLGLPIAQSVVSRHGGVIEHARENGETAFSILLPIPVPPG